MQVGPPIVPPHHNGGYKPLILLRKSGWHSCCMQCNIYASGSACNKYAHIVGTLVACASPTEWANA